MGKDIVGDHRLPAAEAEALRVLLTTTRPLLIAELNRPTSPQPLTGPPDHSPATREGVPPVCPPRADLNSCAAGAAGWCSVVSSWPDQGECAWGGTASSVL